MKSIEDILEDLQAYTESHNYAGGWEEIARKLSPSLLGWQTRDLFFEKIFEDLRNVSRVTNADEVRDLQSRASKAEHILNLISSDASVPPNVRDASIRYVVEHKQLTSWPLVQEALVRQAAHGPNRDVRRLAWFHVCKHRAHVASEPKARSGWFRRLTPKSKSFDNEDGKNGGQKLKNIRESLIRNRTSLGPRGTIFRPAEIYEERSDLIPELLTALAKSTDDERNEVALTLGEIGGEEVSVLLSDALRSEIDASTPNEDFQVNLISALSNIGGSEAVEGLLQAAERGSERVRQVALSNLEWLATAGAVALTEYPEPISIVNSDERRSYQELAARLRSLASISSTPIYVRHKANELLDTVLLSLKRP